LKHLARSTSVRLAAGYAALFLVSSFLVAAFVWWNTAAYLDSETDAVIIAETRALADRFDDNGVPGLVEAIRERLQQLPDDSTVILLVGPARQPLAGNLAAWPLNADPRPGWYEVRLVRRGNAALTRFLHFELPGGLHLLVGRVVQERVLIRHRILEGLLWGSALVVGLAFLGGLLFRRLLLARVEAIASTAARIADGDLSQRVPTRGTEDEFDELAATINRLLAQIEQLIEGVRNVSNAIAHDLRTPLTELRSRLETLLRQGDPAVVEAAIADTDRLIGVFNALLRLAEIDSGMRRSGFRRTSLRELLAQVVELYEPAAEAKDVTLTADLAADASVDGDPSLLAQAVGNLLDNAVKYTPPGGHVGVTLRSGGDEAQIVVADDGPGIPEEDRAHAIERFWRGDRSRHTPGVGLGLSVVSAVARLHRGRLDLADNDPGVRATLTLPALATLAAPVAAAKARAPQRIS
jgi:signal transduction histidine kinase